MNIQIEITERKRKMEKLSKIEKTSQWCHNISVALAILGGISSLICAIGAGSLLEGLTGQFNGAIFLTVLLIELFITLCGCLPLYAISVILQAQAWQQQEMEMLTDSLNGDLHTVRPTTMKCPHCGQEISSNSPFCGFCGTRIFKQ